MNTYLIIIAFIMITAIGYMMVYKEDVIIDGMEQRSSPNIFLLGDSVLNNKQYVPNDKSVGAFLKKNYPETKLLAKDDAKIKEVYDQLKDMNKKDNQFIFLSVGGNDIMKLIDRHGAPAKNENIMEKLRDKVDGIFSEYVKLVDTIQEKIQGAKIGLFNIYYPIDYSFDFNTDPKIIENLITYWNDKLSKKFISFNEDKRMLNNPLLIRIDELLTEPGDFIKQIEPSVSGGRKLATLMVKFIKKTPDQRDQSEKPE